MRFHDGYVALKGYSTQKWTFCHHLLTKARYFEARLELWHLLCQTTVWFQSFFRISSFVFSRRKKLTQVCNNLRVS